MPNYLETLGQQVGTQVASEGIGAIMGLALEGHNDRRQLKQQGKLQDLQMRGQREMTDYNMMKQLEMWKATSYGAQKEQMIKAGLNPALLYGMSGGGGSTTGSANGAVSGGEAPKGGGEVIAGMGMGLQAAQLQLLNAQRKNIEADTKNKEGDAANKPLVGENIKADTALKEVNWNIASIQEEIQGKTQNAQIAIILSHLRTVTAEMHTAETNQKINYETANAAIEKAKTEAAMAVTQNELMKAQEDATRKGAMKTAEEIEKIKKEVEMLDNYWKLDDFIERKKVELINKGINVALISSIMGGIMNLATMGRKK